MFALLDRFDEYIKSKGKVAQWVWDIALATVFWLVMYYFVFSAFYGILTTGV